MFRESVAVSITCLTLQGNSGCCLVSRHQLVRQPSSWMFRRRTAAAAVTSQFVSIALPQPLHPWNAYIWSFLNEGFALQVIPFSFLIMGSRPVVCLLAVTAPLTSGTDLRWRKGLRERGGKENVEITGCSEKGVYDEKKTVIPSV